MAKTSFLKTWLKKSAKHPSKSHNSGKTFRKQDPKCFIVIITITYVSVIIGNNSGSVTYKFDVGYLGNYNGRMHDAVC